MGSENFRSRQFPAKLNTTSLVKMLVLYFLSKKNYYGNEIIDKIESSLDYRWRPSPGMIYPLLRDMEDNMLIEGWWDEPDKKTKRHYRITNEGLSHFERIKSIYKPQIEESLSIINSTINILYK